MKKNLLLFIIFLGSLSFGNAQTPQGFKYQAVARDLSGIILSNKEVSFRISILKGSATGEIAYSEIHKTSTNNLGLVNLQIGNGSIENGLFSNINWGDDSYFVKIELDDNGDLNFKEMGTSQLMAVPYAMFAHSVENDKVDDADADPKNELQTLTLSGTTLTISNGNSQDLSGLGSLNYWKKGSGSLSYSEGSVAMGISSPTNGVRLDIEGLGNDNRFPVSISNDWTNLLQIKSYYDLDYTHSGIGLYKARGTKNAPANVREGDRVGGIYSFSYFDNGFRANAGVEFYVGTGLNTNSYPSYILFGTTAAGEPERSERMRIDTDGNVGIGSTNPRAKLQVSNGDIYIENVNKGVIMKSPNGQCWRMTVDNLGAPVFTAVTCP